MKEVQKQIKEIENGLEDLLRKVMAIRTARWSVVQQKALRSFTKGIRGLHGCELGELLNAFEIGEKQKWLLQLSGDRIPKPED